MAWADDSAPSLSIPDLITKYALEVNLGQSDRLLLKKIAQCESGSRQFYEDGRLVRGVVDDDDVGAFQTNLRYHAVRAKELDLSLYSTEGNIKYAIQLYKDSGSSSWNASKKCWG